MCTCACNLKVKKPTGLPSSLHILPYPVERAEMWVKPRVPVAPWCAGSPGVSSLPQLRPESVTLSRLPRQSLHISRPSTPRHYASPTTGRCFIASLWAHQSETQNLPLSAHLRRGLSGKMAIQGPGYVLFHYWDLKNLILPVLLFKYSLF